MNLGPVYVGVSKSSCFNCSNLISVANDIKNNIMEVRGSHNAKFGWKPPKAFMEGYNQENTPSKSNAYKIGKQHK